MKKIMSTLISAMCLATGSLNCVTMVNAADNSSLMGDVNGDGKFNIADVVLCKKYLLGVSDTHLTNWEAADLSKDNRIDVFDLVLMKRALIEELNGSPELEEPEVREILFGYSDAVAGYSKPMSEIRIAMNCKAFCPSGDTLKVDVARLGFSQSQNYEGNDFLYKYVIYPWENWKQIEDDRIVVNGETGGYEKSYLEDDRLMFNVGREYDDYSTYHHEVAELDFQKYTAGSSGCIAFNFVALFYNDDGTLPEQPQSVGNSQSLYFYVGEDGVGISNSSVEDAEEAYQTKGIGSVTSPDIYTGRWHGKDISFDLYQALKATDSEIIPVSVVFNDIGMNEFVYQGRTIQEYIDDKYGEEDVHKLEQLLNHGDLIKYGETLYTIGTPDGVKWTKIRYDLTVEFYGDELLSKYIVDGEFLKEQLQADLKALNDYYQSPIDEAVEAFYQARIEETIKLLEAKGIKSERIADTHNMVMYVTAEEFDELSLENTSYYGVAFQEPTII